VRPISYRQSSGATLGCEVVTREQYVSQRSRGEEVSATHTGDAWLASCLRIAGHTDYTQQNNFNRLAAMALTCDDWRLL